MIVVLGGQGRSTRIVIDYLARDFDVTAIVERPVPASQILRRRVKKLGNLAVVGQAIFIIFSRFQTRLCRKRVQEIERINSMNPSVPEHVVMHNVCSANDEETITLLRELAPEVVVVNGTRILSARILQCIPAAFINTHAGITPKYRGVHGAYWAYFRDDASNAGVTVHLVDPGIDTGGVLYQAAIKPELADCFSTYPSLQLAAGLPFLKRAVQDGQAGRLVVTMPGHSSELFYHPTLWQYLRAYVRGVR